MHAQQSVSQAVKRANPHRTGGHIEQTFCARAQLCGRFVGKRHSKNAVGRYVFDFDQPGNAMYKYPGFTTAGTGNHQGISKWRRNSSALRVIKPVNNVGYIQSARPS